MSKAARIKHPEQRIGELLLGKWRLEEILGMGAMAAVYSATHRNGKRVAIKMLHAHLAEEATVVKRFLREGYAANRVGHPAVVSALDDNTSEDGCPFLVLDLIEGVALDELLLRDGPMPPERVLNIADQVLDALIVAHEKGVLHRDLKPENLVLTSDERVRILDFGIAKVEQEGTPDPRLTLQGRAMGTPGYMPPEQAQGLWERVDARSDLWALAATMFALLTGREVHEAVRAYELLIASITKQAEPIRNVVPEIPEDVANIVDRALAFHPSDRFPSARVMQEWVRDAMAPPPSRASASGARHMPDAPPSQAAMLISRSQVPPPLPPRGGRMRRAATAFALATLASVVVHVCAAKATGDPHLPLPSSRLWESGPPPNKLLAVLPYDAAHEIAEPPAEPSVPAKAPEITLPPIELDPSVDPNAIDLDALPEDDAGEGPHGKTSQVPPQKPTQFLAQAPRTRKLGGRKTRQR